MLQRASWLMLPFGPEPTISQSMARYFVGIPVGVCVWLFEDEEQWVVPPAFTVTVEEGSGLCADVEGRELQCEVLAMLLGGLCVSVEAGGDG